MQLIRTLPHILHLHAQAPLSTIHQPRIASTRLFHLRRSTHNHINRRMHGHPEQRPPPPSVLLASAHIPKPSDIDVRSPIGPPLHVIKRLGPEPRGPARDQKRALSQQAHQPLSHAPLAVPRYQSADPPKENLQPCQPGIDTVSSAT